MPWSDLFANLHTIDEGQSLNSQLFCFWEIGIYPKTTAKRFSSTFIKAYKAYLGEPAAARRTSERMLFREDVFYLILNDIEKYVEMLFSYLFKTKSDSIGKYGYSLMYGKWAVVASIGITNPTITADNKGIFKQVKSMVEDKLEIWKEFDEFVKKKRSDTKYFEEERANYELYYKVNMLDEDVSEFFSR